MSSIKTIKVIQANIWRGKLLPELLKFLADEDAHIILMQEVSGGSVNLHNIGYARDSFACLKNQLGLNGVVEPAFSVPGQPASYFGNAVLTRGEIIGHETVFLQGQAGDTWRPDEDPEREPRNALIAEINISGFRLHALSTHLSWGKPGEDTAARQAQAWQLVRYIQSLGTQPFILGGDLNITPNALTVDIVSGVARNVIKMSNISTTTNPRLHSSSAKVPNGLILDYIFTSEHFRTVEVRKLEKITSLIHLWELSDNSTRDGMILR